MNSEVRDEFEDSMASAHWPTGFIGQGLFCGPDGHAKVEGMVESWHPAESDGEGFDHISEMITDLDLDRRKESLVIGDVRKEGLSMGYREIVRTNDGAFLSKNGDEAIRFQMHRNLSGQLERTGWGVGDHFAAICVCLKGNENDLPECIVIQFEGGPLFKVSRDVQLTLSPDT